MNLAEDFDEFTAGYIECMMWSSTTEPYGTCPECGKENKPLSRWNEDDKPCCYDCSERESHYEPPTEDNYDVDDISPELLKQIKEDCDDFQKRFGNRIIEHETVNGQYSNLAMAGHDYWLTRNGHGSGFWDTDWEKEFGLEMTEACKKDGEFNIYVGDDGKLYGE